MTFDHLCRYNVNFRAHCNAVSDVSLATIIRDGKIDNIMFTCRVYTVYLFILYDTFSMSTITTPICVR